MPELYNDPGMLATNPYFSTVLKTYRNDKVCRPSKETGKTISGSLARIL